MFRTAKRPMHPCHQPPARLALAAALAVMATDDAHESLDDRARLAAALRTFRALPHRLEPVAEVKGVLWINDSKATNVASARVAIEMANLLGALEELSPGDDE